MNETSLGTRVSTALYRFSQMAHSQHIVALPMVMASFLQAIHTDPEVHQLFVSRVGVSHRTIAQTNVTTAFSVTNWGSE